MEYAFIVWFSFDPPNGPDAVRPELFSQLRTIARQQLYLGESETLEAPLLFSYVMVYKLYDLAESSKVLFHRMKRVVTRQPHPSLTTPTVREILADPRKQPRWPSKHDEGTPLEKLYLMYYCFVRGNVARLRRLVMDFCDRHEWKVKDIPDPQDSDPERYAILSVIPQWLCDVFNRRINRGLHRDAPYIITIERLRELEARPKVVEEMPEWAMGVPRLKEEQVIPNLAGNRPRNEDCSKMLLDLGVVAEEYDLHFV